MMNSLPKKKKNDAFTLDEGVKIFASLVHNHYTHKQYDLIHILT